MYVYMPYIPLSCVREADPRYDSPPKFFACCLSPSEGEPKKPLELHWWSHGLRPVTRHRHGTRQVRSHRCSALGTLYVSEFETAYIYNVLDARSKFSRAPVAFDSHQEQQHLQEQLQQHQTSLQLPFEVSATGHLNPGRGSTCGPNSDAGWFLLRCRTGSYKRVRN